MTGCRKSWWAWGWFQRCHPTQRPLWTGLKRLRLIKSRPWEDVCASGDLWRDSWSPRQTAAWGPGACLSQALGGVAPAAPLPIGGPGGPREDPVEPEEGAGSRPASWTLWFGPGPPDGACAAFIPQLSLGAARAEGQSCPGSTSTPLSGAERRNRSVHAPFPACICPSAGEK